MDHGCRIDLASIGELLFVAIQRTVAEVAVFLGQTVGVVLTLAANRLTRLAGAIFTVVSVRTRITVVTGLGRRCWQYRALAGLGIATAYFARVGRCRAVHHGLRNSLAGIGDTGRVAVFSAVAQVAVVFGRAVRRGLTGTNRHPPFAVASIAGGVH